MSERIVLSVTRDRCTCVRYFLLHGFAADAACGGQHLAAALWLGRIASQKNACRRRHVRAGGAWRCVRNALSSCGMCIFFPPIFTHAFGFVASTRFQPAGCLAVWTEKWTVPNDAPYRGLVCTCLRNVFVLFHFSSNEFFKHAATFMLFCRNTIRNCVNLWFA